jgi:hypothetical protein
MHYLIDYEGKALSSPFHALRQTLGSDLAETALIDHVVANLGYAHVQEWKRGLVVSYRKPITRTVTLAGVVYLLTDLPDKRVILSIVDGQTRYSLCRGRAQAIGRLVQEMRDVETVLWQADRMASAPDLSAKTVPFSGNRSTR